MFWTKREAPKLRMDNTARRGRFCAAVGAALDNATTGVVDRALLAGLASDLELFAQQLRFRLASS